MYDVIIVGQGPAGVSAAIYAVRAGLSVLVVGRDSGALAKAEKIENYYGFIEPISGHELLQRGLDQAVRLGVTVKNEEVTAVRWIDQFSVETTAGEYQSLCVILATGMPRRKAVISGLSDYEGRGVSYCATCDGFFYRGKTVAVIGNGDYALKEAAELKPFAKTIYLMTNGRPFAAAGEDPAIQIRTEKIEKLEGDDEKVRRLVLDSGATLEIDGVFVAEGTASALDLALKLGLDNDGKRILVNKSQETNLPGMYAAGDCTGGLLQVAVAVGEGAQAGVSAVGFVRQLKKSPPAQQPDHV
ncbi:MAG: FAD-dependent oxidoreductase [Bacillota bacterium]|nr:FAD-dependent oxidoreductase [Bacillota bacterium]